MTQRAPLPARRDAESFDVEHNGQRFRVQVSEYPDGQLGEVFVNTHKNDGTLNAYAGDIAILISLLLQHGVLPAAIGHALRRNPDESRASVAGVVADALAALDRGEQPNMIRKKVTA